MSRARVILADPDEDYIAPLQLKFAEEFFNRIDLEIITDKQYYDEMMLKPQKADIFVVSNKFYEDTLKMHNISNIFVLVEQDGDEDTDIDGVTKILKYTSIKSIFNKIIGKSGAAFEEAFHDNKGSQVILVTSGNGGAGKTTIAMGIATVLAKNYKNVLYLNAALLQCFGHMLDNPAPIYDQEVYNQLANPANDAYVCLRSSIRQEAFYYIPPFKAALISLWMDGAIYGRIVQAVKESGEYDYIIVDAESTFNEWKTKLFDAADKIVIITEQNENSIEATNLLISNINVPNKENYFFICNHFDKNRYNALVDPTVKKDFNVHEYINSFDVDKNIQCADLQNNKEIKKLAFLML